MKKEKIFRRIIKYIFIQTLVFLKDFLCFQFTIGKNQFNRPFPAKSVHQMGFLRVHAASDQHKTLIFFQRLLYLSKRLHLQQRFIKSIHETSP